MDAFVFFAVLTAALFHALWNAGLKVRISPGIAITLMSVVAGAVALPLPFVFGLPAPASWPYLAASLAIHLLYYIALAEAYRTGDLGQVYPIARGSAPLMTAIGSALLLGEALGLLGWTGVVVLTSGVALLSLRGAHALRGVTRSMTIIGLPRTQPGTIRMSTPLPSISAVTMISSPRLRSMPSSVTRITVDQARADIRNSSSVPGHMESSRRRWAI
jgi:multidrug transporter EmrE-like cation transporter